MRDASTTERARSIFSRKYTYTREIWPLITRLSFSITAMKNGSTPNALHALVLP